MTVRLLPVLSLVLSGCAVGDVIGMGASAVGDGTKYIVDSFGDAPETDPDAAPPETPGTGGPPAGGPPVTAAPAGAVEVQPLD